MAERRMFAKTIIDSDAFLDMPLSAQSLYFHLAMRADDDGFINNPKKIQRMIGASEDDCKLLIAKKFVLVFDTGVIVIRHWKLHNYIQKDRYKPTIYQSERNALKTEANGMYTQCIHDVSNLDTQDRLESGKDSLELGEESIEISPTTCEDHMYADAYPQADHPKKARQKINYQEIADMYNAICTSLPRMTTLSDKRKEAIAARLKHYTVDQFREMFTKAENSAFLKGSNNRNWTANFDWLVKDANFAKVLDGNYDNTIGTVATGNQTSKTTTSKTTTNKTTQEFETNSFDIDELYNMALQKSYKELGLS